MKGPSIALFSLMLAALTPTSADAGSTFDLTFPAAQFQCQGNSLRVQSSGNLVQSWILLELATALRMATQSISTPSKTLIAQPFTIPVLGPS